MYNTQRQFGATRQAKQHDDMNHAKYGALRQAKHKWTPKIVKSKHVISDEKQQLSIRRGRNNRYALTNDDKIKIIEKEQKEQQTKYEELCDREDKLNSLVIDPRPRPVTCYCLLTHDMSIWTSPYPTKTHRSHREREAEYYYKYDVVKHVQNHFENCVLQSFIMSQCVSIVMQYVGKIHAFYDTFNSDSELCINWQYVPYLGTHCIDNKEYSLLSNTKPLMHFCTVSICRLPIHERGLCQEHYDQWKERPIKHFHTHECKECTCYGYRILNSITMKLDDVTCPDITATILAMCGRNEILFECKGHLKSFDYTCEECDVAQHIEYTVDW
jgi:hypothetical protein